MLKFGGNTFFVFIIFLLCSCSVKEQNYSVKEINGVKIYKNKNIPSVDNLQIKTEKIFTIKGHDERTENNSLRNISDIMAVDFDTSGNIYILCSKTSEIKKFDKNGSFVRSFGKMGTGPGETKFPQGMFVQNDTINVLNQNVMQMVKYDQDGNFICNVPTKQCGMLLDTKKVGDDKILGYVTKWRKEKDGLYWDNNLSLISSDYTVLKELKKQSYTAEVVQTEYINRYYGNTISSDKIFIASKSSDNFHIDVLDFNGNKIYSIEKGFIKIKEHENIIKASKNKIRFKKAIQELHYDKFGRLWAIVPTKDEDGSYIDIFDEGVFLNRVKVDFLPNWQSYFILNDDRIYVIDNENLKIDVLKYQ